jgi:hypothetical protein
MSAVVAESSATAARAPITGYVEAATAEAVLGWAWIQRRPQERVTVELVLDGQSIASTVADGLREDLARNGIGDGRHAFSLSIPPAARPRAADLRVVASLGDGDDSVPLGQPPAPEGISERLDRLQRGLEMVVTSQRVLHRTLQATLVQPSAVAGAASDQETAKDTFAEQLRTLEIFVMRLDDRLAAIAPLPETGTANASVVAHTSRTGRAGTMRLVAAVFLGCVLCLGIAGVAMSMSF